MDFIGIILGIYILYHVVKSVIRYLTGKDK